MRALAADDNAGKVLVFAPVDTAGVSGILQFLILRVRGRTRVQSRELPAQTVGYLIITVKPVTTSLAVKKSGVATVS